MSKNTKTTRSTGDTAAALGEAIATVLKVLGDILLAVVLSSHN